ncbi:MAG: UDP-glucose:undecaprenyl-phosphate glucose-1-phosphate transferase [Chlamydiales bacterium]|nr:UDP-glucose:undecaprenyl-phosphate glucose-1-phosphate transferase [Chlamydiales bacterium]MCH9620181.1 UDP-glucose:undecaprenyl-phosphate glucose-1-phosphate transferase [Chlamydiales bacterium]MCH9623104.1 UDP-glucose:undecaprenyl-phosphate glucose-1-phosphate transferase [Chlamydiales bacterium]
MKRWVDLPLSLIALILLTPFFLLIAVIISIASPGPIFYSQKRLGKNGKVFCCYKFRTMHIDADNRLTQILQLYPEYKKEWVSHQKLKEDPRIFSLGRVLRRFSLDELPQFYNVLKGDLSIVGPRPYMVDQKKLLGSYCDKILSLRPGITGLWQTSGRSSTTFKERIKLDAAYVDRRSPFLNLQLILKTVPAVFFQNDAC